MAEMRHQELVGVLRELVVLCCAFGVICNGHPTSKVVKNQVLKNYQKSKKGPNCV